MNLDIIEKHVHLTPLANGNIEVMFSGQPCLVVSESYDDGYSWKINPLFAKLTYGANIFEDVPYCYNSVDTVEEAIAEGLSSLNDLGAFRGVIDLPADTYAEEHLDESVIIEAFSVGQRVRSNAVGSAGHHGVVTKIGDKTHEVHFALLGKKNVPHTNLSDDSIKKESVEDLDEAVTHKELLAGAQKAYIDATRQGNGVMAKHYGAQILKHKANIAKQMTVAKAARLKNESVEELDEREDREDDEGYARTKKSDDAYNASIARRKAAKPVQRKTPEQEKAEWDKWVKECIVDDCRKEALKHSDSIMEAHDLAQGLLDSVMDELNEISIEKKQEYLDKAVPTHQKQFLGRTAVPATKQQLDKRRASIQKVSKELTGKTHYQESVEELDEATDNDDRWELYDNDPERKYQMHMIPRTKLKIGEKRFKHTLGKEVVHSHSKQYPESMKDRMNESIDEATSVKVNKPGHALHGKTGKVFFKHADGSVNVQIAKSPRKGDVQNVTLKPGQFNEETLDEAALSGDAYWKAKEEAAKEAKAKEERASMGIKEPVKKGRGKPTNIDLEFVHAAAKKNLEAGKRPTTGMDRNEKIHFVRHLSKHPDFADHHVAKAGRPTGTTAVAKVEKEKVKKAETSAFSMWAGLGKK